MSESISVGKVVMLDLVSGVQVCGEIKEITETALIIRKPMVFQVAVEPQDPSQPPHQTMNPIVQKINAAPYGGPFIIPKTEMSFEHIHVIAIHDPQGSFEKGYLQAASGIEIAGADALRGGPGIVGA